MICIDRLEIAPRLRPDRQGMRVASVRDVHMNYTLGLFYFVL